MNILCEDEPYFSFIVELTYIRWLEGSELSITIMWTEQNEMAIQMFSVVDGEICYITKLWWVVWWKHKGLTWSKSEMTSHVHMTQSHLETAGLGLCWTDGWIVKETHNKTSKQTDNSERVSLSVWDHWNSAVLITLKCFSLIQWVQISL